MLVLFTNSWVYKYDRGNIWMKGIWWMAGIQELSWV